jgi:hypothetical protein
MGLVAHRALDHLLKSVNIIVNKTLCLDFLDGSEECVNVRHMKSANKRMLTTTRHLVKLDCTVQFIGANET